MALRINTNIASLNAQRNLSKVSELLAKSYERLSSGLRINRASDDAAGLAISERMRADIRSLNQAGRNANDGISMIQTAEGALGETNDLLVRMRELAVQSSNGTLSSGDKDAIDAEFQQLVSEIDRIAQSTEFNDASLLDGTTASVSLQIGKGTTTGVDTISVAFQSSRTSDLSLDALDIGDGGDTTAAISAIDAAITSVTTFRSTLGGSQNRLESTVNTLAITTENLVAAESRIRDVDVAAETAALTKNSIIQQAAIAVLAQANIAPRSVLDLI